MTSIALFLPMAMVLFQIHRGVDGYFAGTSGLTVTGDHNKMMYGHSFLNFSRLTMTKCLEYCLSNCLCLSFQLCDDTQECQLCSSNKYLIHAEALKESNGCTNFNFEDQDEVGNQQCGKSCTRVIHCCMTSSPCLNGGTCLPPLSNRKRRRFRCKCPDGYEGERCEVKLCEPGYTGQQCEHRIRSCRGYSNGNRVPRTYTVFNVRNSPFDVYCDFDKNSSMTWTLIQSYSFENNDIFKNKPLSEDFPQNENGRSWLKYRLSKSRMQSIQENSTKWRITCRYETDGVVLTDYLRASKVQLNLLNYDGDECKKVEYINIRGHNCTSCDVLIKQRNNHILHFHPKKGCFPPEMISPSCTDAKKENYFGYYECSDIGHRCTSSNNATTQTWIGGE